MVSAWTVPKGRVGLVTDWTAYLTNTTNGVSVFRLQVRLPGEVFQVKEEIAASSSATSSVSRHFTYPRGPYSEGSDIVVTANSSANNLAVASSLDLLSVLA